MLVSGCVCVWVYTIQFVASRFVIDRWILSSITSFRSEHTDCIVAEDSEVAEVFLHLVNRCFLHLCLLTSKGYVI